MKRIAILIAMLAALVAVPAAAQVSDTCRVFMQLYDYTGAPARNVALTIKRMTVNGYNIAVPSASGMPTSDGSGVVQFRAFKSATVWLYAPVAGLDSASLLGKPIALSNAAQQWIVPVATASVPARHIVSIADLWAGKGATVGYIDTLLFAGTGATVTKSFGTLTVDVAASGGASAYGDSIRVADSLARLARDIANGKGDADSARLAFDRLGDRADADSLKIANDVAAGKGDSDSLSTAHGLASSAVQPAALTDSLNALPRAAFDSTRIHQVPHEWTAQQKYTASLAAGGVFVPLAFQGWTNPDAYYGIRLQRNDFGLNKDYTLQFGYNPGRTNTSEPELVIQLEPNYFNTDSLLEYHVATTGQNGSSSRGQTGIARRSTGRWIDMGFNAARVYLNDTLGLHPAWARFDSPSRTLDFDTSASLRILQANQTFVTAYNGSTYTGIVSTSGNTTASFGGAGWTTAAKLVSGAHYIDLQGTNGKCQVTTLTWSGTAADSTNIARKGYVDTRLLSFTTTSALTDSLNGVIRPGALTAALAAYATLAALTDTVSKFPRGWLARDTLHIGPTLDGMYARSGGAGVSTDSLARWPWYHAAGDGAIRPTKVGANGSSKVLADTLVVGAATGTTFGAWLEVISGTGSTNALAIRNAVNSHNYTFGRSNTTGEFMQVGSQSGASFYGWYTSGSTADFMMRLTNTGGLTMRDTFRVGNYTTYSYIIPGGALVQSSTRAIKKNITDYAQTFLFNKVLSVNPVTWNYRAEAFKTGYSESDTTDELKREHDTKDNDRAAKLSAIRHTGFIAEDFAAQFGGDGKSMNQSEVIAVLWKTNQELITELRALKARVEALEKK